MGKDGSTICEKCGGKPSSFDPDGFGCFWSSGIPSADMDVAIGKVLVSDLVSESRLVVELIITEFLRRGQLTAVHRGFKLQL